MKQRIESTSWMEYKVKKKKIPDRAIRRKRLKKNKEGLREVQDNVKGNNTCINRDTRRRSGGVSDRKPV